MVRTLILRPRTLIVRPRTALRRTYVPYYELWTLRTLIVRPAVVLPG